jgi:hypothetical protein
MVSAGPPRGYRRVAYECGFRWGLENVTEGPAVPPDRDLVVLDLTVAEARAALALEPNIWWHHWAAGWVAGLAARNRPAGGEDA